MNETLIIGLLVLGVGILLIIMERRHWAEKSLSDPWLYTVRRRRRRTAIGVTMGLLGSLLLLTGSGHLPIEPTKETGPRVANLVIFVTAGGLLSLFLALLAMLDVRETVQSAARQILAETGKDALAADLAAMHNLPIPGDDKLIPRTKSEPRPPNQTASDTEGASQSQPPISPDEER